jgi:molybdate/tungstate transport system permease protein
MVWVRQKSPFILVSTVLGFLMVLFILIPLIGSVGTSLQGLPGAFTDSRTLNAIFTSFYCAFVAAVFVFVLGVPLAYMLARYDFPGKHLLDSVIDLPILIPHNAAGLALLVVLTPASPIGSVFKLIGIDFRDTVFGIIAAMAFVSAPFLIRGAQESFRSVDPAMEKAARGLGASRVQTFRHVTFPLALRGILTGCLLTWARAVSEFGAVVVLAYFPQTAPVHLLDVLWNLSGTGGGLQAALPISSVLIILAVVIFLVFRLTTSKSARLVY